MIKLSHLSYQYRDNNKPTLADINLTIDDGEVIALVGQNGSGKSTLGRLIAGILPLQTGYIEIDEKKYDRHNTKLRKDLGIVFQNPENQIIFNRIDDEISFALQDLSPEEIEQRTTIALRQVGMSKYRTQDLYSLSLGQKQRIVIAEALARQPKYLILDEPTTMIDSQGKQEIYQLIRKLKHKGYTIVCITNLADEILLADRTLILANGKIRAEIPRAKLIESTGLLDKYHIHQPTLLQILSELDQRGINLDLDDFTITDFADQTARKLSAPTKARKL